MSWENLIRAVCLVLVALPATIGAVAGMALSPSENAALLVLALLGGTILSELKPATRGGNLSDDDVRRIAEERERLRRAEIQRVREAVQPHG